MGIGSLFQEKNGNTHENQYGVQYGTEELGTPKESCFLLDTL
ncbi:hypothetical protein LBMAG21_13250 [Armatimonadota bacterium]|nr:hypothetical protein LBMAG21_13250 [Armatimonadota bacterium]